LLKKVKLVENSKSVYVLLPKITFTIFKIKVVSEFIYEFVSICKRSHINFIYANSYIYII